jgi:hypothetical protein
MKIVEKAVYLDVCALGRPYDDQQYPRIQIEKAAVDVIVANIKHGKYALYYSPIHEIEIASNPDEIARSEIMRLLHAIGKNSAWFVSDKVLGVRARELYEMNFGPSDAFHIAYAEKMDASLITCDDRLLRRCQQVRIKIWCGTPDDFCRKERLL